MQEVFLLSHFEKKLESTLLYEGKILSLRRDKVELEDGRITSREVVEHNGGVAVLAVDSEENILFVSQFRYPFGKVLLELPAGKLEKGEDPAQCGRRELLEECGCKASTFQPLAELYPTCAYDTEIIRVFYATGLEEGSQSLDPGEFLTVEKIPIDQAVEMALAGKIPDAKTQLGILKYKALRDAGRI